MPNEAPTYSHGCLMLDVVVPQWAALQQAIPDAVLYRPDRANFGRASAPHCTILFGFKHYPGLGEELLARLPLDRVRLAADLVVTGTDVFENAACDVVKFSVQSAELDRLNRWCRARYAYVSDFPDYLPHLTLAYVRSGEGAAFRAPHSLRARVLPAGLTYSVPGSGSERLCRKW